MAPLRRRAAVWRDFTFFSLIAGLRHPARALHLVALYQSILVSVLRRKGLFDRDFYLTNNQDVADSPISPLRHYVRYGDKEGRWPMPLFDPHYYGHVAGLKAERKINRLLHYVYVGRHRGVSPSPWFDVRHYLATNKDVARSGIDPLYHFLRWGGNEGRSPSPLFDCGYYLRQNPDVRVLGLNPLVHFLRTGSLEGRRAVPLPGSESVPAVEPLPVRPAEDEWEASTPRPRVSAKLDVIVPVHGAAELTLRCLQRVLSAKQRTPYELVVINDASPDPDLVGTLERLAAQGLFQLIHNTVNEGFVRTANKGMALHPDRDVILLNSDTEVFGDWLDRLVAAASKGGRVATVTPLSNNATICSYPNFLHDNPYPLELDYRELDGLARAVNSGMTVEAPTGVGFCMYICRAAIREVGVFDAQAFGKGYGEENDFCQRAIRAGWKNLIAADVFVRHWGGASFQGERTARLKEAEATLRRKHPSYHGSVRDFIRSDPLADIRSRLDLARLRRVAKPRSNVLIVCHARGGGTERHVMEDARRLRSGGSGVFFLRPSVDGRHVSVSHFDVSHVPNLKQTALKNRTELLEMVRFLGITEIHVHHLIDLEPGSEAVFRQVATACHARLRFMVHDYTAICPRVNLVDGSGVYCGEPAPSGCDACISLSGSAFGRVRIKEWRLRYHELLQTADSVVVPDGDVAVRMSRYFPDVSFQVVPHEAGQSGPAAITHAPLTADAPLRVAIIGAISKIKGFDVVLACAREARSRSLPLEFVVYGYTMNDQLLKKEGLRITGRYLDEHAVEGLSQIAPHVVWFPYVWPETYSYTLSIALRYGRPIFAFDIGAIASRLRAASAAQHLEPIASAHNPAAILERFMRYRAAHLTARNEFVQKLEPFHELWELDAEQRSRSVMSEIYRRLRR